MQKIGFTGYEAKVYIAALQQGLATGYELSRRSGVPQAKVYEILSRLVSAGALQALASEPVRYAPLPPEELLRQRCAVFQTSIGILQEKLPQQAQIKAKDYVWNISGYREMLERAREVINNVQGELLLSVWPEEAGALQEALESAVGQGVRIRAMVFGDSPLAGNIKYYRHGGEQALYNLAGGRWLVVAGKREVLIGQVSDDGDSMAAWSANAGIVFVTRRYIEHELYIASRMEGRRER